MEQSAEGKILAAAKRVFVEKGLDGARMQEIADEAGMSKASLHYYYRSKQHLFDGIYMQVFSDVIPRIFEIINSDLSLFDIIRRFFEMHIEFLKQDPSTPMFVLRDINRVPHLLERILKERNVDIYAAVNAKIADAVERGDIKFIRGEELILNMVSLSIFQFAGAPIFKTIGRISDEDFDKLIEERKKTLAEFVISAIKR
ncbi:TetR/AcrR family transcriptional regulator [uncultured Acetobacteroides sp.]|uniref:TetR/AcrR family transcriptional regulator n=1 Tax=uncultured Acetobacteroides sp. TaxID=1760811 RepID=UPI0029F57C4D|nr:TetR/AcrR family transcriptional regulator [uncultured Acetobacteroides sp.]